MERFLAAVAVVYISVKALPLIVKNIRKKNADKELTCILTYLEKTLDP